MHHYLILQHPGHNPAYFNVSGELALAELQIATGKLNADCLSTEIVEVENIRYLSLKTEGEITAYDLEILSRLSFVFTIFKVEIVAEKTYFVPIAKQQYEYVDPKISGLLKYQGKPNELFTKMMISVAVLTSDFDYTTDIQLLDPIAGRGTTLFEGVVYGFHVSGVESDTKSVGVATTFFRQYLKNERFKHTAEIRQIAGASRSQATYCTDFEYAADKEEYKDSALRKNMTYVIGESQSVAKYFKANQFHVIVGDLPSGSATGNTVDKNVKSVSRDPSELLNECLPEWYKVLKIGGVVVLGWNSIFTSKEKLRQLFVDHNFEVFANDAYDNFEHLVDRSIKRNIIVAKKLS